MEDNSLFFATFLIFTGAALFATVAMFARQALPLAYILLGVVAGPWGLGLVDDPETIQDIAQIGIIFLLFLLGLNLKPQDLLHMFGKASLVTLASSMLFGLIGVAVALAFGFGLVEALVIGAAMMFSSTIIGLKLLPTTMLHHQHIGEIIISILLLQDLIAILILMLVQGGSLPIGELMLAGLGLPLLAAVAFYGDRYVLFPLIARFDTIQEYVFLLAIGWCLGFAELAGMFGLSHEIGAFIAGVAMATSPIAMFIADSLRPLRDFFLVMFFFSLGAGFALPAIGTVFWPALLLAVLSLAVKPGVFRVLLVRTGETERRSREVGVRLAQISEFSLLIALAAAGSGLIGERANYLIQLAVLLSFALSSIYVVRRYPTPIAVSDSLRRD
ncbi:MAG: cation:proton antiporter [Gammaproteobacteria bacterium]|jgi:Kef-type K+ transport system membrane component KefB|nr:cation:proton antiporter [Gammaproteobacteria bacterium]